MAIFQERSSQTHHHQDLHGDDFKCSKKAPKGHFVVYVGKGVLKRFVIPLSYLKNPVFQELLEKSADEFGFDNYSKGIVIPCDESTFRRVIEIILG